VPPSRTALVDAGKPTEQQGPGTARGPDWQHAVQFYQEEAFLFDAVARYAAAGLIDGDAVVLIATAAHWDGIHERLVHRGIDVERALGSGRMRVLDAHGTLSRFLVDGMPSWDRFQQSIGEAVSEARRSGSGRVRAYGEMVDVLWREGQPQAALRLEQFWNDFVAQSPLTLLCAYLMGNFYKEAHGEDLMQVCGTHDHVVPAETFSERDDPETRGRAISLLQQRAMALETELRERKRLQEELRRANEQAEAASKAKDEFLAMLGHELRNPLAPILTAVQLMKLRGDGRITKEQEIVERQTQHLIRLVDDLLDIARITRGKVELRKRQVDLRDVIAKATEIASPLLEQKRHHFTVSVPPRGLRVLGDEDRLSQVVANLLTNAARYTETGGHIAVNARRTATEVVIEVRDDGIGIEPDLLPRIFDLFVQGRQSVDRASGGLGIGLALVRNLVILHGGAVAARSEGPGAGSTFSVRLPALAELDEPASAPQARASAVPQRKAGRRILVVDDNEDALEMLKEMLEVAGHDVRTARDGLLALQVAREFQAEVAILDLGLPAMDGYELAARLRAEMAPRAPRLVALTGYGQHEDRARSRQAGFALHLVKPLDSSELLQAIEAPVELN
jgi:signal transduction histidine kinase